MPKPNDESVLTPITPPAGKGEPPKAPSIAAFKGQTKGPDINLSADTADIDAAKADKPKTARKKKAPKPKPGRKKKKPELKESEILALKLTEAEIETIRDKAGLTPLSTYVKHYIRTQTDLFKADSQS